MSKRYGRNRKRHHREQIEELERQKRILIEWERAKVIERESLACRLRDQEAHLRQVIDTINDIVAHSALTPPTEGPIYGHGYNPERLRLVRRSRRSQVLLPTDEFESAIRAMDDAILEVDLWELTSTLESYSKVFEKIIHVLVPGRSHGDRPGHVAYRISQDAYHQFLRSGKLPELAKMLYRQIFHCLQELYSRVGETHAGLR